jgi:hypothetical protein
MRLRIWRVRTALKRGNYAEAPSVTSFLIPSNCDVQNLGRQAFAYQSVPQANPMTWRTGGRLFLFAQA